MNVGRRLRMGSLNAGLGSVLGPDLLVVCRCRAAGNAACSARSTSRGFTSRGVQNVRYGQGERSAHEQRTWMTSSVVESVAGSHRRLVFPGSTR